MRKLVFPCHIIILMLTCLFAERQGMAQQLTFQHLTVENGLSQNAVLSLGQDEQGFMWLGTSNGLNRYDGYRFKVYHSRINDSTTINGNTVLAILSDRKKELWVGTSKGLNRYLADKDQFQRILFPGKSELSCNSIYEDKKGNIWIGTGEGLFSLENGSDAVPQKIRFKLPDHAPKKFDVRAIYEDRTGTVWIGTTDGLIELNSSNSQTGSHYYHHSPHQPGAISGNYITTITEDRQGVLWVGTLNNGLNQFNRDTRTFTYVQHRSDKSSLISNNIRKIILDRENRLWVGTQEGISILNDKGELLGSYQQNDQHPESLSQNSVHSLFQDLNGTMWIGTYFGGVNFSFGIHTQFSVIRKNDQNGYLSNNVISSFAEDEKKNLWIGTEGGGLNYFDRSNGKFHVYKHNPREPGTIGSNLIKVVYRDWQGQIWSGTHGGGLNLFDPVSKTFRKYLFKENDAATLNSEIVGLYEDSKGRFWVGTTFGLHLFNRTKQELTPVSLSSYKNAPLPYTANYFLEDDRNRVWVATTDGLYKLEGEIFTRVSVDQVNCIQQDSRSQLWFGMKQGGLAKFDDKTQQLVYHNKVGNVANRNILGILEDNQQNLWLSSDKGLIKYQPEQKLFQLFTVSDGLAGNAFNYNSFFRDQNGEFFFGGYNGISHFFPDKIQSNNKSGSIVLTGLKLSGSTIETGDSSKILKKNISSITELTLKHNQTVIGIEFALLNFVKSNKNSYAYQLDGYDKEWIYTQTPIANYANIPPGHYRFKVKGSNNDGIWSETISLPLQITPPFWLTGIAYTLYAILIGAVAFFVIRYFFLGALLKKEEELHQVKLNFFTNISHEIRTHLTLIMAPVEKMLESENTNQFSKQQLKGVKLNAIRLLKLVSELMDFRKAETGHLKLKIKEENLIPFLEEVYDSFRDISIKKGIVTSFIYDGGPLNLFFDREQLEKVFFNLLTNAIKFTPENGRVWVHITESKNEVRISVTDNGRGIAPEFLDTVFTNFFQVADHGVQNTGYGIGLALAKNIIELHHGTIRAESQLASDFESNRTSFIVSLLKGTEHFEKDQITILRGSSAPMEESGTNSSQVVYLDESLAGGPHKTNTILLVEDNAELITLIREGFKDQYRIEEASNGQEGWEKATELIPDLIISDVMMPLMDGFEMCTHLKQDERTSHIPVILLTAKSTQTDHISGLETGADMYLTKPFSTKVLELNVRNLLTARERLRSKLLHQFSSFNTVGSEPTITILPEVNTVEQEFMQKLVEIIEEQMENPAFGVEMLAKKLAMSPPILYKKIKAICNMSVNDFVKSLRLKKAAQLLSEKKYTVYEVAYAVGYSDRKYFSQEFKKQFGKTPTEYTQELNA